jgi:hypothetical protein
VGLRWTPTDVTFVYDGAPIWSSTGPISRFSQYIILSSGVSRRRRRDSGRRVPLARRTTNMQADYVRV